MDNDHDSSATSSLAETWPSSRLSGSKLRPDSAVMNRDNGEKEGQAEEPVARGEVVLSGGTQSLHFDAAKLLRRQPVIAYGEEARRLIFNKRVLVTGAGGSIGSELIRQLDVLQPEKLFLLDHDESLMHSLQLEVFGDGQLDHERTILADIRDQRRLSNLFCEVRPDLIFHAAAHKHLAILERYPSEAVRTNVAGTENVIRASQNCGAERLTFVSTDKAADPTSVLGATKRIAEVLVHQGATRGLRTASVRFGNVLGSRGSFLHTLAYQLRAGIPVTVTHPLAERFFMSIPEAAALVIEASVQASRGETYVLDMGTPVRILELMDRFLESNDLPAPEVRYTGLVPGEKLSERLFDTSEVRLKTKHPRIWQVPAVDERWSSLERLEQLYFEAALANEEAVRRELWACAEAPGSETCLDPQERTA